MLYIPWLDPKEKPCFPNPEKAPAEGIVAAGGRLTPEWLLEAYRRGIFPWYSEESPILWWCPHPRLVLEPERLKISRSLIKTMRNKDLKTSLDRAFRLVIATCALARRPGEEEGTWITTEMIEAYCRLHDLGHAHSVECWRQGTLVGGLYGVLLRGVFFGESMFHLERDASKIALARLCFECHQRRIELIDCQVNTPHLASLGAVEIPRREFLARLRKLAEAVPEKWDAAAQPARVLADYFRKSSSLD